MTSSQDDKESKIGVPLPVDVNGFALVAVVSGPTPEPQSLSHSGQVIYLGHDGLPESDIESIKGGSLHPLDQVIELQPTGAGADTEGGETSVWLVLRSHYDVQPATILVVEDNELNGDYYQDVLTELGVSVMRASSGAEALETTTRHSVDLALVDVRLPDVNGYELCRTLNSEAADRSLPIILMSADPTVVDSARVATVGAAGFIVNPIGSSQLARTVEAMLNRSSADTGGSLRATEPPAESSSEQPILRLFGRPAVWSENGWTDLAPGRGADTLATLAAACPLPVTADRLALIIWKKGDDVSPNAVYTAVSRLRTQLAGTALDDAIVTDGLGYRLTTDPRRIDLVQFEQTGRSLVLDRQSSDISALRAAIEAYTAEPFPATKNEFLIQWKNRLRETRSRLVEILVVALIKGGRAGDAVELCHDLVAEEPWRESTWSLLVIALYRAGRANDALEAHRTARDQLREVLGLDPGPGLAELEVHVLRHDPLLLDDDWLEKAVAGLTARNLRGRGDSTSSGRLA